MEIKIIINNIRDSSACIQPKGDISLGIEQKNIILTPKQYEEIYKKLQELQQIILN